MELLKAVIWDVDGTMAETERDGHRVAFNLAFESCAIPWRWGALHNGELLPVSGGRERLMFDMAQRADAPPRVEREALARALHARKNVFYDALVRDGRIALRAGVLPLMQRCRALNLPMAVATTTSRTNLNALLQVHLGARWADWFAVTVCAEDVSVKKPDPQAYRNVLQALGVAAQAAVAIEDAPAGVTAACAAGVPVIVTRSEYFSGASFVGATAVGPGLHTREGWQPSLATQAGQSRQVELDDIEHWRHTPVPPPLDGEPIGTRSAGRG